MWISSWVSISSPSWSTLLAACLFLVECMGIDVQRSRNLRVSQQPGNRGHIRPAGDHQASCRVPQAVHVQVQRKSVLLQNQFEPPGEGAGSHGQVGPMAAEDVVLRGQLSALVEYQLPLAERAVFFQQTGHLQGEVHVPVSGCGLGFFYDDVLPGDLHHISAYMDGLLRKVYVLPLQTAAFPTAHPCGDDKFEVGFVLNALLLQCSNEFPGGFLISNIALFLLFSSVFVGAPGRVLRQKIRPPWHR